MVVSINKGGSAVPPLQGPASMDTSVDVSRRSSPHTTPTEHAEGDCDMHIDDPTLPQGRGKRNVTWWRLAMITFVFTCTGPGGLEQVMIAGGPIMALFGIFAVPFIYVMPQIFVVSELGSMMPTSAGNVVWVHRAFGRFTGFYNAWIFSLTNMIDMAVYPSSSVTTSRSRPAAMACPMAAACATGFWAFSSEACCRSCLPKT
jgi:hypothetical protein